MLEPGLDKHEWESLWQSYTSERMETARRLYEANGFRRLPGNAPRQGQQRLLYELRL